MLSYVYLLSNEKLILRGAEGIRAVKEAKHASLNASGRRQADWLTTGWTGFQPDSFHHNNQKPATCTKLRLLCGHYKKYQQPPLISTLINRQNGEELRALYNDHVNFNITDITIILCHQTNFACPIVKLHQLQSPHYNTSFNVTQLANQHMHTFNFLFIKTYLKFLKTLLHVSVIRPSSGSL